MGTQEKIAVIGLGYVGMPLMAALARNFEDVLGFDIDKKRVEALGQGRDWTGEMTAADIGGAAQKLTCRAEDLDDRTIFIVTVPTPIDQAKRPDLLPVLSACRSVGEAMKRGIAKRGGKAALPPVVVLESTVYPGLTDDICAPEIAKFSGLRAGIDFRMGYSPERINPGDKVNTLENVVKIVSANDAETLARLAAVYGKVIKAGIHQALSIKVAEAAKVIENTQRDINIALMNELAIICDRLGIRTHDVLQAAGTKWNFLKFSPGLVGGHCIGVDPYYLTARAEELGYHPQVILAGRRINDSMAAFVGQKVVKLLVNAGKLRVGARVGILGLAFKENVRDLRNSRVPEIAAELEAFGLKVMVHDPVADPAHAKHEYGLELSAVADMKNLDAMVLAVPHRELLDGMNGFWPLLADGGVFVDIKSAVKAANVPKGVSYWSL